MGGEKLKNVLLIEDEKKLNSVITDFLSLNNLKVHSFYTPQEAMEVNNPDVIMFNLPYNIDNYYRDMMLLKKRYPNAKVIVVSSFWEFSKEDQEAGGMDIFLKKPLTMDSIIENINKLI